MRRGGRRAPDDGRAVTDLHVPDRPAWTCKGCGVHEWPCDDARAELKATYDLVGLSMYCAETLADAAGDLPDTTSADLHAQSTGWTKTP
jgi:hypothetical protein